MQQTIYKGYIWNVGKSVVGHTLLWRYKIVQGKRYPRHTWVDKNEITILI